MRFSSPPVICVSVPVQANIPMNPPAPSSLLQLRTSKPDMRGSKAEDRRTRRVAIHEARRLSLATGLLLFAAAASAALVRSRHNLPFALTPYTVAAFHPTSLNRSLATEWQSVIRNFMDSAPPESFSRAAIESHYHNNVNNAKNTTMLVTIRNGRIRFKDNFGGRPHGRASSVRYILRKILRERADELNLAGGGVSFLVMVTDGHRPRVATFGSARHWRSWKMLIPTPLGNNRGLSHGWGTPLQAWDPYIREIVLNTHKMYPWKKKIGKALFRGALAMQTYTLGSCNEENGGQCLRAFNWTEVNRGVLYLRSRNHPNLFNVGFTALKPKDKAPDTQFQNAPKAAMNIRFPDFQRYKLLINVGSNQDWAERLRALLFTNSAVVLHEAETQEFFTPLLRPWVHYVPTDLMFNDLVKNVKWALRHDYALLQIVRRANEFAKRYISERAMLTYWEAALKEFAERQRDADADTKGENADVKDTDGGHKSL